MSNNKNPDHSSSGQEIITIDLKTLFIRGVKGCCPQCGSSNLFKSYLKVAPGCSVCHLDYERIRSDDVPAYFTIAILAHILLPLISFLELYYHPDIVIHLLVWPVVTVVLALVLLPRVKGTVMAILWKVRKIGAQTEKFIQEKSE